MGERSDARVTAAIEALPRDALLAYLSRQRWFAAKAAASSAARIVDAVVAPWGGGCYALARASIETAGGAQLYQLPIGTSPAAAVPEEAMIARVTTGGESASVYDAMHDPAFRAGLARALAEGATARGDAAGTQWIAEPTGTRPRGDVWSAASIVGSAEQSNTSIVFANAAIYKLFRLLKPGIHPDVEVTAFLTNRAHFPHTPALLATCSFDDRGERTVAGMLQEYFPDSIDAWRYTLEHGRSYFTAPEERDAANPSLDDARQLGAVTRELHEALACDESDAAFAPEPVTPHRVEAWARRTQQAIRDSLAMLDRQSRSTGFPSERLAEATALVGRAEHYVGWIDEVVDSVGGDLGEQVRIHGDYHLGQVLRTKSGEYKIIDFEGEPLRPLAERREKASPLRDVAGMLRSFSYAAASLAMSVERQIEPRTREIRSARWERDVRGVFLEGYLAGRSSSGRAILPRGEEHVRQLIALFETEKAFYELAYELNNRPSWVWIPMRGIAKLFTR